MKEEYDFMTNEQEKKDARHAELMEQATNEVNENFMDLFSGDEIEDILIKHATVLSFDYVVGIQLNASIERICREEFFDDQVTKCYEKLQAKGEE
jgi:hypothetical protein